MAAPYAIRSLRNRSSSRGGSSGTTCTRDRLRQLQREHRRRQSDSASGLLPIYIKTIEYSIAGCQVTRDIGRRPPETSWHGRGGRQDATEISVLTEFAMKQPSCAL